MQNKLTMFEPKRKRRVEYDFYDHHTYQQDVKDNLPLSKKRGWRTKRGWFVDYGLSSVETETTIASHTVCIIENDDNGIDLIIPQNVHFL